MSDAAWAESSPADVDGDHFIILQPHLHYGGAENQSVLIANGLVMRGAHCSVILHRKAGGLVSQLAQNVDVVGLGFESHALVPLGAFRAFRILKHRDPSIIIVRLWSSIMLAALVQPVLRKHRFFFVEDLDPTDHTEFIRFGGLKRRIVRHIFRNNSSRVIANTHHVADSMIEEYGLQIAPRVIACSVSVDRVRALASSNERSERSSALPLRCVSVGSLVDRKGLIELTHLLGQLPYRVEWTIVGDGPLGDKIMRTAASYPNVAVKLVAGTSNPYRYMAIGDVFVHGAKSESFGIVLVEALVLGIPVVARAANGPKEIKETLPDAPIELFDDLTPGSFADAIAAAIAIPRPATVDIGPYHEASALKQWRRLA